MKFRKKPVVNEYFIKLFDLVEIKVSKEQFIQVEELCGFYSKEYGETATGGFGMTKNGLDINGRIKFVSTSE